MLYSSTQNWDRACFHCKTKIFIMSFAREKHTSLFVFGCRQDKLLMQCKIVRRKKKVVVFWIVVSVSPTNPTNRDSRLVGRSKGSGRSAVHRSTKSTRTPDG